MFVPETLYVIEDGDTTSYARTPDGVGAYWYDEDQYEEAKADVCEPVTVRTFHSLREFELFRERWS